MIGPHFDDPLLDDAPVEPPDAPSRLRRGLTIVVALTVVASMVLLLAQDGRRPTPTPRETPGSTSSARIAVVEADGRLVSVDEAGGSRFGHDASGVQFLFPAWSPDGSRLAAVGRNDDGGGVYVFDGRGGGARTIVYESADRLPFYLYWSPDGRHVSFLTSEPDGIALRLAPADGSAPATTVREGAPMYWDWIGSDRLLVHSGGVGPDAFVGEVGLDGGSLEQRTIAPGYFRAPDVSRDGRYRSYVVGGDGPVGVLVVESRDGTERHETTVFGIAAIGFDPTGEMLAFIASDQRRQRQSTVPVGPLRLVDSGSGAVRTILDGAVFAFFWAPDGRTIAALRFPAADGGGVASTGVGRAAVGSAGLGTGADVDLAAGVGLGAGSGVGSGAGVGLGAGVGVGRTVQSTSGITLALAIIDAPTGTIRSEQSVRLGDLFVDQLMPFFDQYALSHRLWSPDGSSVLLPLVGDDDTIQLVAVPADGSAARPIAAGVIGFWSP
jgi:hypothetical protein